ncbi:MAG: IS200/IS605 family transposase [Bacteroidetes bacterium]|nr:IS200/IS605 family transposase [Bacteroidota bacterium]
MSWVRVYIHLVFSTKNREPFLNSSEIRKAVFQHIKQNAKEKGIWLDSVNGWNDHAHCLISLGGEQTISKVAQMIKGESSFWINHNNIINNKFTWQDDFWAVGVSERNAQSVRNYIHRQEEHHNKESFTKEVNDFMVKYGWSYVQEADQKTTS